MSEMTNRLNLNPGVREAFSERTICVTGVASAMGGINVVTGSSLLSSFSQPGGPTPTVIPRSQVYYWSHAWQAGEAEGLADIEAGRTRVFNDPGELARYLLNPGDE